MSIIVSEDQDVADGEVCIVNMMDPTDPTNYYEIGAENYPKLGFDSECN